MTDNILEIRTKRSEYATIAARTTGKNTLKPSKVCIDTYYKKGKLIILNYCINEVDQKTKKHNKCCTVKNTAFCVLYASIIKLFRCTALFVYNEY